MEEAWRITKAKHAASAFSGEGAATTGGRWNSRGWRVVYTSATQSLAALETLVHLNPPIQLKCVIFRVEFSAKLVERIDSADLSQNWQVSPAPLSTRRIGNARLQSKRSAVLAVPSVLVPGELNYLLNPGHPDFRKIRIGKPVPFAFDPRLLK